MVHLADPTVHFHCASGFSTHQLAYMLDSLVRVSRRAGWKPSASILRAQFPKDEGALRLLSRPGGIDQVAIPAFVPPNQPMLTSARRVQRPARDACARAHPMASKRFPLNNFKYFLTLFSKFFSSFPHGTCSLSVSCCYLALDGIYHPISAALSSNATR